MKARNKCLILFVIFFYISCQEKSATDAAIRYKYYRMENNGWKSRTSLQQINEFHFSATEVPLEYYLIKDLGNDNLWKIDSIQRQHSKERIVEFEFLHASEKDILGTEFTKLDYTEGVKYMSFLIAKDFLAITSKNDTVPCSGVSFERKYKIDAAEKIILFFEGIDPKEKIQLVYYDQLFRNGIVKFKFEEKITKMVL